MRIAIASDAWYPQVNGVVTTLSKVGEELTGLGHEVHFLTPSDCITLPCPTYPDIRLAVLPGRRLVRKLQKLSLDAVHIATEGPLGHAMRRYCLQRRWQFTTSYHTQFPQYIRLRAPIPEAWTYAYLRHFHAPAARTLVATASLRQELRRQRFRNVMLWSRGVDTTLFRPRGKDALSLPRPIHIYVGRVAVEKNLRAFLGLDLPGSKVVIGEGPDRALLERDYAGVHFLGVQRGEALAVLLSAADVFVFPSRTDTFGLVMLEAMACGIPVAAYPVTGPRDIVTPGVTGALDENLRTAIDVALQLPAGPCIAYAQQHSWRRCAELFSAHLVPTLKRKAAWLPRAAPYQPL